MIVNVLVYESLFVRLSSQILELDEIRKLNNVEKIVSDFLITESLSEKILTGESESTRLVSEWKVYSDQNLANMEIDDEKFQKETFMKHVCHFYFCIKHQFF